jgi:murein DD-endopeptidase MepM/ murein hydrolase activator NlpD
MTPLFRDQEYSKPAEHGTFGYVRKYDIHTGVDLYCAPGTNVHAIEDGIVVAIEAFTGVEAGSPWWRSTQVVLVEGASGVIAYGEIIPYLNIRTGEFVSAGTIIGIVETVLKVDKGLPMTMLHIELYEPRTTKSVVWELDSPKPESLLDVTPLLKLKGIL